MLIVQCGAIVIGEKSPFHQLPTTSVLRGQSECICLLSTGVRNRLQLTLLRTARNSRMAPKTPSV